MQEIAHEFSPGVAKMDDNRREQVNRLMLQYEKDMLKLCYIYLRDYDLAQEALQESFLKVYTRFGTYRGEAAEKTWLTAIVANTCKDILRSAWFRNRQLHVSLDSLPSSFPPPDETQLDLMAAIMKLPVRSHRFKYLCYRRNPRPVRPIKRVGIIVSNHGRHGRKKKQDKKNNQRNEKHRLVSMYECCFCSDQHF